VKTKTIALALGCAILLLLCTATEGTATHVVCTVTAYNATEAQCDSSPTITASNKKIRKGFCAISRDIEKKYQLKFGDKVVIPGMADYKHRIFYEIQDRMNRKIENTVDIYMVEYEDAIAFGKHEMDVFFIKGIGSE